MTNDLLSLFIQYLCFELPLTDRGDESVCRSSEFITRKLNIDFKGRVEEFQGYRESQVPIKITRVYISEQSYNIENELKEHAAFFFTKTNEINIT